ncbi:hypothetical protein AVEN_96993-1 [Araneus ventricosus]|uniref:Secreted protein n=1 Tax=Araneus ventricosus TaxID=182803 RepID=A0A4Y2FPB0_ARAVE|nr:hypothetical protein AVEN_96993-1 [Araneus ventricosus]
MFHKFLLPWLLLHCCPSSPTFNVSNPHTVSDLQDAIRHNVPQIPLAWLLLHCCPSSTTYNASNPHTASDLQDAIRHNVPQDIRFNRFIFSWFLLHCYPSSITCKVSSFVGMLHKAFIYLSYTSTPSPIGHKML